MSTGAAPDQHPYRSTSRTSIGTAPDAAGYDPDSTDGAGTTTASEDDTHDDTKKETVNAAITAHPPASDRSTVERNDRNRR